MKVESSKGEAWPGQHEINFRYADALKTADDHVIYKTGAQGARAPVRHVGHVHGEARPHVGRLVVPHPLVALARRRGRVRRRVATSSSTTSPARSRCASELAIFFAPTINSYKRFAAGSWAPTTLAWALRQPHVRLPHRRPRLVAARRRRASPAPTRTRTSRSPRCSPSGLHGIEQKLELGPAFEGNAYESDVERFPHTLRDAIARLESGTRRAAAARRRGRRPLPELRAHRAAALRRGRHVTTSGSGCSSVAKPSSASRPTSRRRRGAHWQLEAALIPYDYVRAIERAGGRALLVPPSDDGVEETLDALDGILFSGGEDLDPTRTAPRRTRRRAADAGARPRELALLEARSRATCPCSRSVAASRC